MSGWVAGIPSSGWENTMHPYHAFSKISIPCPRFARFDWTVFDSFSAGAFSTFLIFEISNLQKIVFPKLSFGFLESFEKIVYPDQKRNGLRLGDVSTNSEEQENQVCFPLPSVEVQRTSAM